MVLKACRVCAYQRLVGVLCQRLVGCVWVSKACRVCGCRRLVRFVWVSKACSVCLKFTPWRVIQIGMRKRTRTWITIRGCTIANLI